MIGQDTSIHLSFQISFMLLIYLSPAWEKKKTYQLPIWPAAWAELPLAPYSNYVCLKTGVCHPDRRWAGKASASHVVFFFCFVFMQPDKLPPTQMTLK